jgi:isopentenyl diphosphate isomerase/L-lactate dehydrogenase-like FMN-dependent dehydrogenase
MILNIDDLRAQAQRRLPRILWDWLEGGAEDESGLLANRAAFAGKKLLPRYGRDMSGRTLDVTLFGRRYGLPFGIAPTGYTGLLRPGGERMMLAAADAANVPYILSGVSVASLEEIATASPGRAWYQLYPARDAGISRDLARRARDAGYPVLVLTADMPVEAKRERDIRNGFKLPLRYTPRLVWDGLTHPAWTLSYLRAGGLPTLGSWAAYARPGATPAEVTAFQFAQKYPTQTWSDVEDYRRLWPGTLVVKGLLHPEDARRALEAGADGIIVSNHGARQLDRAVAALEALSAIRSAVGSRIPVMIDGGVRRGSDVALALALGADYVFSGRAILYGLVARGGSGADEAIGILRDELSRVMAQLGTLSVADLGPGVLAARPAR